MHLARPPRVGYVLKVYPRYSETFIVTEILAHEAAGLPLDIISLRSPVDAHFQDTIARVRTPVTYLPAMGLAALDFWTAFQAASAELPGLGSKLEAAQAEDVRDVFQALLLARLVRARGIGHLHAHFASTATTVAWLAAHFAGIPYTFTAHAKDIYHESVQPDDLRRKLADAAAVVTVSDFNRDYLLTTFGPAAAGVRRLYNGLELDRFPYAEPRRRPPRIVAVGRLIEKKGFGVLIDACAILAHRGRAFDCQIIGAGELGGDLQARIDFLSLQERVMLLGPRPQNELMAHVQGAAVFAAPCVIGADGNRDGLPTVLLEAMALGTPCVATDVAGIPEVVRDGETGLLVSERDATALANALERLLGDADLRARLAARARQLIEAEFDIHRNAARQRTLFAVADRGPVGAAAEGR